MKLISGDVDSILNFEIRKDAMNKEYHELEKSDFRIVRLVDEDSFVYTVQRYARRQNQGKIVVVICCTIFALVALRFLPMDTTANLVSSFFVFVSGAIPFAELVGLLNFSKGIRKIAQRANKSKNEVQR